MNCRVCRFALAALRRQLLLLATLFFIVPLSALTEGGFTYEVTDGEATITGLTTADAGDLAIPSTLGGYTVTAIGRFAFDGCTALTSVTIPGSVAVIDHSAFSGCRSLTAVTLAEGVTAIGDKAFLDCSALVSVTLPASVRTLGFGAFQDCTALVSATLPKGLTSVDEYIFYGCSSLTSVALPEGLTSVVSGAFCDCTSLTSVTIPASVTSISGSAFSGCSALTAVSIPEGVTAIGAEAFKGCAALTSVTIPARVASIGKYAFYDCPALATVHFLGKPCEAKDTSFKAGATGIYPTAHTETWEAVLVGGRWHGLVMESAGLSPAVPNDREAVIEGSAKTGWVVKPSERVWEVVLFIPEGVDPKRVTVEVPSTAESVTANGATVKVVSIVNGIRHDITPFLTLPEAEEGKIDLTQAEVKREVAKAILDTTGGAGATFTPSADLPITTAPTVKGLTYILLEGDSLDSLTEGVSTIGDGDPWCPQVTQRGPSAFYRIRISK